MQYGTRSLLVLLVLTACGSPERPTTGTDAALPDAMAVDAPEGDAPPPLGACKVQDDGDAFGVCDTSTPPASFEAEVQWTWTGVGDTASYVIPLVANMTDDNGDGEIDLCDTPDVIVVASPPLDSFGTIYVLDGKTGTELRQFDRPVAPQTTPALGDIDGDGLPEIVTVDVTGHLIAFEHDGTVKWVSSSFWLERASGALSLADIDRDGDVEIIGGYTVFDHQGQQVWRVTGHSLLGNGTTAVDLDGDGFLEIVTGDTAFRFDGTLYGEPYHTGPQVPGFPQVANLDDDPEPEILVTLPDGLALVEHDTTITYQGLRPTGVTADTGHWTRPAVIQDFDGDGEPEYAMASENVLAVYEADGTIVWSAPVLDESGVGGITAFDFLGDGSAEVVFADEVSLRVFDATGTEVYQLPRSSRTINEYPVVADIDNDGSAEIVVTSSDSIYGHPALPTVQVIRDPQDRWAPARRIWNQHTYHVTNVREDGTIPQVEPPHWTRQNTFRSNSQLSRVSGCPVE